jgi:hypothetical protein
MCFWRGSVSRGSSSTAAHATGQLVLCCAKLCRQATMLHILLLLLLLLLQD